MRRSRNLAVLSGIVLALGFFCHACGGGGDGGGGGGPVGFSFDNTNMLQAAGIGAAVASFFPPFTTFSFQLVSLIGSGGGAMTGQIRPSAIIPVPIPPGFCVSGSADLAWDDMDNDGLLSTGDAASLTLTNCVIIDVPVSGTTVFDFVDVTGVDNVTTDIAADIEIVDVDTERFTGNFRLQVSSTDGISYDALYGGTDRSDLLSASINGAEVFRFGCFDVQHQFSIPTMDTNYTLRTRGVANVQGEIMTLGSYFGPDIPLIFQPVIGFLDPVPVSGTQTFLSFDGRSSFGLSACAAVGSSGTLSTNGNELLLTATGAGNVTVELFNQSHTLLATESTTWDAIF